MASTLYICHVSWLQHFGFSVFFQTLRFHSLTTRLQTFVPTGAKIFSVLLHSASKASCIQASRMLCNTDLKNICAIDLFVRFNVILLNSDSFTTLQHSIDVRCFCYFKRPTNNELPASQLDALPSRLPLLLSIFIILLGTNFANNHDHASKH